MYHNNEYYDLNNMRENKRKCTCEKNRCNYNEGNYYNCYNNNQNNNCYNYCDESTNDGCNNKNCYCCPVWIKGEQGHQGVQGQPGIQGPPGPLAPQSFVQLYDRNYTNELLTNGNLNLSNDGINPVYSTGEYSLVTTTVKNDTLVLPEPGLYFITLSLRTSFLLPLSPPAFGSVYQILFNILDENNTNVSSLDYKGIIPNDPNAAIGNQLSIQFLYNAIGPTPSLKVALSNFKFDFAFQKQLSVYDIIFVVQKWEKL